MLVMIEALESRRLFASVPAGFTDSTLVTGLANPTAMEQAPDGRIFVTEQGGQLRVVKDGALLTTPALSLAVDPQGERGLLGVTLDPDFANNGFIYLYYTTTSGGLHNRVSRFTVSGDTINPATELILLDLDPLSTATNHNGGGLHFGGDGKLYIATGENANPSNSQTTANLLGKILRINADGTIPTDNPFFNTATGNNRAIWAIGLRNPFTFAVQPGTGRIFINDVGSAAFEEINEGAAGGNYGWPATEGPTTDPAFITPIHAYGRNIGTVIAGGVFYNPATNTFGSNFAGDYFFADAGAGFIRRLEPTSGNAVSPFATGAAVPVDLDVTDNGNLLYLERGFGTTTGRIGVISADAPAVSQPPEATIRQPGENFRYVAGRQLKLVGQATDAEDGVLADGAYSWQVDFHDSNGVVTQLTSVAGARRTTVPLPNDTNTDIGGFYRITLTVADSDGQTHTVTRDVFPRVVWVSMLSNVPGANFTLDGVTQSGLRSFQTVAGVPIEIGAIAPAGHTFRAWSAGNPNATRTITPTINRFCLAIYRPSSQPTTFSLLDLEEVEPQMDTDMKHQG
jgi:glucose/arabinose dehydrogenase